MNGRQDKHTSLTVWTPDVLNRQGQHISPQRR